MLRFEWLRWEDFLYEIREKGCGLMTYDGEIFG